MNEIIELLEQGRVVVAKAGEKADPEELAAAVLHYCEAAGYTISEVDALELAISMARVNNTRKSQRETRFVVNAE